MSLSPDEIKKLLTLPRKARSSKPKVDPDDRTYQTWFKLAPKLSGGALIERPLCSNPNCTDDRPPTKTAMGNLIKLQHTIDIDGVVMCRRCFLAGYGLTDPAQLTMNTS